MYAIRSYYDPLFDNNFKIVYSVYNDEFTKPLNEDLPQKLSEDGVYPEDVSVLSPPDWINLSKFAIDNSDGIVITSYSIHYTKLYDLNCLKVLLMSIILQNILHPNLTGR